MSISVPPIDEQFVSDAVNTIEGVTVGDIAELWVDQKATGEGTPEEFQDAANAIVPSIEFYL